MADRILFVDADESALDGFDRILRTRFKVSKARGGAQGLATIQLFGPFAVVIADMCMPLMNGAEFLAHVRQMAPDSVRILLTGHHDMAAAIQGVNEGRIFRYLTKPCGRLELIDAIKLAVAAYHAVLSEKEGLRRSKEIELGL